jgi:hypothetical protein
MEVYGKDVRSRQNIMKWCTEFFDVRVSVEDFERTGMPTTARSAGNSGLVENLICSNRSIILRELQHEFNLLHGTLIQDLGFNKMFACWVA